MKKPLIFAIRGALGFSLTTFLLFRGNSWLYRHDELDWESTSMIFAYIFLAGLLGGTLLFFGGAHWKRATVASGTGLFIAFFTFSVIQCIPLGAGTGIIHKAIWIVVLGVEWGIGHALFGGICGYSKHPALAKPGVIAFGLPALLFGVLAAITAGKVHYDIWYYYGHLVHMPNGGTFYERIFEDQLPRVTAFCLCLGLPLGGALFGRAVGRFEASVNPARPQRD